MKKVVAILLAGVLVLGGAVTAFAAGSQEGQAVLPTVASGEVVVSNNYTAEDKAAVDALVADKTGTLAGVVGTDKAADMELSYYCDVSLKGNATCPQTVTFTVKGVITTESTVYVLHYLDGAWHQENATLGTDSVTVTFDSLSPVAIYVDKATAERGNASTGTSPKTGEAPVSAVATMIALCAVAGLVVSSRRRHA